MAQGPQHGVAGVIAIAVIDEFEFVHIHDHKRHGRPVLSGHEPVAAGQESVDIAQAGHGVQVGQGGQGLAGSALQGAEIEHCLLYTSCHEQKVDTVMVGLPIDSAHRRFLIGMDGRDICLYPFPIRCG